MSDDRTGAGLSPTPALADEPTTALDATGQIQTLLLLRELQWKFGMGVIFITPDIGVAVEIFERIAVMDACRQALPAMQRPGPRRRVACLRAGEPIPA